MMDRLGFLYEVFFSHQVSFAGLLCFTLRATTFIEYVVSGLHQELSMLRAYDANLHSFATINGTRVIICLAVNPAGFGDEFFCGFLSRHNETSRRIALTTPFSQLAALEQTEEYAQFLITSLLVIARTGEKDNYIE